jgi:hypothetical protein
MPHPLYGRALRECAPLLAAKNAQGRVEVTLPGGTFRYRGVQAVDKGEITLWAFEIHSGVQSERSGAHAADVGAMNGPAATRALAQANLASVWRRGVRLHRP